MSPPAPPGTLLFWRTDGAAGTWTGTNWSNPATATGGTAWTSGNDAQFSANSTVTFATTAVSNVTVDDGTLVTVGQAGTLTLAGVRTFHIGTGSSLTWPSQSQSAAAANEGAGIIKNGAGTLDLGAIPNNVRYDGGFTLNAGTVIVSGSSSFGAPGVLPATLTVNGGTITVNFTNNADRTFANPVTLAGDLTLAHGVGAGTGNGVFSGAVALGTANRTITNNAPTTSNRTFSGVVSGGSGGALTFAGTGITVLSGANTYTGGTTIRLGTLSIPTGGSISHSGADMVVGNLSGDNGALTISGGSVLNGISYIGKDAGSAGTATVTSGSWDNNGNFFIGYAGTGSLNISGGIVTGTGILGSNGGTGTATVSGGTWNSTDILIIGSISSGTLNLTDSGVVNVGILGVEMSPGTLNIGTGGIAGTLNSPVVKGVSGTPIVNFNHTGAITFTPQLTGSVVINKSGAGTTSLSASNTYTGATTVSAGTLLVNGSTAIGSAVTVNSTGTLGGTGTVNGPVTVNSGGTVAPGLSPGILNTRGITFTSGSNFNVEINGTTVGTQYDQLNVTGTVALGGATLNVTLGFTPVAGNAFTIINNDSTDGTGNFAGLGEGATFTVSGTTFAISYIGGTGNDVVLTAQADSLKYQSKQTGDWSDFNTWQVDSGSGFVDAVLGQTPTSADDTITIRTGHTITVSANVSADQVTVDSGGNLRIDSGVTLTIDDGTGTDLDVNGINEVNGTGFIAGAGAFSLNTGATLTTGDVNGITTAACGTGSSCGSIRTTTRSFSGTANYNYSNGGAQVTGDALTAGNNITVQSATILTLSVDVTVNGTFNVNSGTTLHTGTRVLSGGGVFNLLSGGTLGIGHASGITAAPAASGNVQTGTRNYATGASYIYNGSTNQAVGDGLPSTIANLTIANTGPSGNNTVTNTNSSQVVTGALHIQSGIFSSATQYVDVTIDPAATLALSGPISVSGNWTNNGTFTHNGFTVTFNGSGPQTITTGGTGVGQEFGPVTINKSGGSTALLNGNFKDSSLTITAGIFDQGASFSLFSGPVTVSSGATWNNIGTGDLTLSGDVSNAGTISFNANGTTCGDADSIQIRSSDTGNPLARRTWSGAGTFLMVDLDVADQATPTVPPPAFILVRNGTNAGNNGTGWIFDANCLAGGTYTWVGNTVGANTDWQVATNWSPSRVITNSTDVLIFDGGVTPGPTVTNVPTQTIARLRFINGVIVQSLSTAGPNTLTIAGESTAAVDFEIANSSQVNVSGTNALKFSLATGATGSSDGLLVFTGGGHRLLTADANAMTFTSPAIFTAFTGFTGNAFGAGAGDGATGSVLFANGSSYFHHAGDSPFGSAVNPAVAVFQTGSTATWLTNAGFQASGRTYANLTIGSNSIDTDVSDSGSGNFQFDNLTMNSPSGSNSTLTFNGSGTSAITIQGDITSNGAGLGTLPDVFLTAGAGLITISKPGGGTVFFNNDGSNARAIDFESNATIASSTNISLRRVTQMGLTADKTMTVSTGADVLHGDADGYVIGFLKRMMILGAGDALRNYPVGTANGYSPVDATYHIGTAGTYDQTVKALQDKLPSISGTNALQRYWNLSAINGPGAASADVTFNYLATDVVGTEANYKIFRYNGSFSEFTPDVLNTTSHFATLNNVSSFSDWTLAEPAAVEEGTLQFVGAPYTDSETDADHPKTITVSRTGGSDGAVNVTYTTSAGTATAGTDYIETTGTLHWNHGETGDKTFTITVNGDTTYEANETVNIALSNATNGTTISPPNATTLTITNDDAPPATVVVNTTDDVDDGFCGPAHTSLREAINCANFSSDASTINFNIPNTDTGFGGGIYLIRPATQLPTITQRVTIDGATQTAFGGETNPNGPEVVINGSLLSGTESGLVTSTGAANTVISNLIVNGFTLGTGIAVWSSNTQVLNNYLGTNDAGTVAVPNAGGLAVGSSAGVTSGYTISGNLISGNTGGGIGSCDITSSTFSNNKIGTDRVGTGNLGNGGRGITSGCSVWGNNTISGNTIAFNNGDGWRDDPDYRFGLAIHLNNRVTQNSFHSNAGLGINLSPPPFGTVDGVTPNDAGDGDEGGNHLQNFPVITVATAGSTNVAGTLNTTPSTSGYVIEIFSNDACDPSGNGEGKTYLGTVTTGATDVSGNVSWNVTVPALTLGQILTATATDSNGNTSEFSLCFTVTAAPTVSIGDVTLAEGSSGGTTNFSFLVTLSAQSASNVDVTYSTADGATNPATGGSDYVTVLNGNLSIPAGQTSGNIVITVNHDTTYEANETFFVNLTNATNASINDGQGIGTITNDDPEPTISINSPSQGEGNSGEANLTFSVTLSNPSYQTITVNFSTADGTTNPAVGAGACGPGIDYVTTSGSLTFNPGDTSKSVDVPVCGDMVYELNETFTVTLDTPANSTIGTGTGTGTINNDDAAPVFTITASVTHNEGSIVSPPTTPYVFTITRTGSTEVSASVDFATADGTTNPATGGTCGTVGIDYTSQSGTLTFLASGSNTQTVTVAVCKDTTFEPNETFFVNLSNPTHASLGSPNQGIGNITNDDSPGSALVVNTTGDLNDGVCNGTHCSLREAINAANTSPSAITINFAIPATDLGHFYYTDDNVGSPGTPNGTVTLANVAATTVTDDTTIVGIDPDWAHSWWSIVPASALPTITPQTVIVNGYSQCPNPTQCAQVNTATSGTNAVLRIELNGNAGAFSGLSVAGGSSSVNGLVINRFGVNAMNLSGSGKTTSGNFLGTDVSGTLDLGNLASGVSCSGSNHNIGGSIPDAVNLISGNNVAGIALPNCNSNFVFGNLIGTKANGTAGLGNSGNGISITGAGAGFNAIGGTATGEGNTIAFNGADGIGLPDSLTGNRIRGNSIYSNGATAADLGIDLGTDGVTANDPLDPDSPSGVNKLQNFPIIRTALAGTPNRIRGTLNSEPNQTYTIDLYANTACDTSGNGEGKTYLGSTTADTGANGDALWSLNPTVLNAGEFITATATDSSGSTSEFSACFQATGFNAGTVQFVNAPYTVSETNADHTVTITVSRTGGSNLAVDVNYATSDGTATDGEDYVGTSGTLHWNNGEMGDKTFTITVKGDTIFEGDETVNITLSGATISAPNPTTLTITNNDPQPALSINDVALAEGNAGTTNFIFTVTKTNHGAVSVNYQTQNGTATIANSDFQSNGGTLTWSALDTTPQTITVLVNGDTAPELIETFSVLLSGEVGATLTDGTGLGTIINDDESVSTGQLIISEFRLSGPGANATAQANNEFIEVYNNTNQDLFVTTTDGSAGWAVATSNGVEVFHIPNATTIPARGHFLGTNTNGYSLNTYPAGDGTFATGDATWTTDVPNNTALAVFRTNNAANFNTTNRLDSVGPNTETNTLYREGTGYSPLAPADLAQNLEHTFFRQICVFQGDCPTPGRPRDTEVNAADFIFADTIGAATSAGQRLGSPGSENLASPIKRDPAVNLVFLDATVSDGSAPNRDRNSTSDSANASLFGTMTIRRRVVNQTGGTVTRLRFRVIDMTTHPSGPAADLRLRSSSDQADIAVNDSATCSATGTPSGSPPPLCTVTVKGLTLEQPPNVPAANGGGLNTTVTLPLPGGLPDGQSINVNFRLGVQKTGQFRFYLVIEALP